MQTVSRVFVITAVIFAGNSLSRGQWFPQSVPTDVKLLLTTDFSNAGVGAAAGYTSSLGLFSGRAIYTTDGGLHWALAQVPDSARSLVTLSFVTPETAYIAGAYNVPPLSWPRGDLPVASDAPTGARKALGVEQYLRRIGLGAGGGYRGLFLVTTNAGRTWFTQGTLPDSVFYVLGAAFVSPSLGYATVDAHPQSGIAGIVKTTDGGQTWTRLTTPDSIPSLRNIAFLDPAKGIAVGYQYRNQAFSGVILRTTDGGASWNLQNFPAVDNFTDVCFLNSSTGYAVGVYASPAPLPFQGAIFKTLDAGETWSPLNYAPGNVLLEGVRFAKETPAGIIYGERTLPLAPFVARTTDGGLTWTEGTIDSVPNTSMLIGGKLLTPLEGYLCGGDYSTSAVVLHTTNGGVTALEENSADEIRSYTLSQNYPNPFNPTTRIAFSVGHQANVRIEVFTLLGVKVATLVSESLSPGNYSVEWNAAGLPSGTYFCRMRAGAFSEHKKLVLLK